MPLDVQFLLSGGIHRPTKVTSGLIHKTNVKETVNMTEPTEKQAGCRVTVPTCAGEHKVKQTETLG